MRKYSRVIDTIDTCWKSTTRVKNIRGRVATLFDLEIVGSKPSAGKLFYVHTYILLVFPDVPLSHLFFHLDSSSFNILHIGPIG